MPWNYLFLLVQLNRTQKEEKKAGHRHCFPVYTHTDQITMSLLLVALFTLSVYARTLLENDIIALNYALTLEHLEAYYYNTYAGQYPQGSFDTAGIRASAQYIQLIRLHENAHVDALRATIRSLGGTPVPPCTYNFSVGSVNQFVAIARVLENTGVSAYDGAINTLANADLRQTAATIATVEARHAAYLNDISGIVPFPEAFDVVLSPNTIVTAITPFIVSCPYNIQTPAIVYINAGSSAFHSISLIGLLAAVFVSLF